MAAGITVPHNRHGLETHSLIHASWPTRYGEVPPKEFSTTHQGIGIGVSCHSGQSYAHPSYPAGTSKRISAFYRKTGCLQHRTEGGFRDTRAAAMLTELPLPEYGTMRQSTMKLPHLGAGTTVLRAGPPSERSRASGRALSEHSRASGRVASERSRSSAASSAPTWAKRSAQLAAERGEPWNFESLPMYERTNETYGKTAGVFRDAGKMRQAGKSDSGFMEPSELVATLTRPS